MPNRTIPRLAHTAKRPCVRVSIPGSRQNGALSVYSWSTAKHRTLAELLPPCPRPVGVVPGTAQKLPPLPLHPTFALLSYNHPPHLPAPRPNRICHRAPPAHTIPQQRSNGSKGGKTIENAILFHGVFGVTAVAALLRKLAHPMPVFACLVVPIPFIDPQCKSHPARTRTTDTHWQRRHVCLSRWKNLLPANPVAFASPTFTPLLPHPCPTIIPRTARPGKQHPSALPSLITNAPPPTAKPLGPT